MCMFLHKGKFWSSKSFLEGECLAYWPRSHSMPIWGSGDLSREKFPKTKLFVVVVYFILSRLLFLAFSANLGLLCMPHPGMGPLV